MSRHKRLSGLWILLTPTASFVFARVEGGFLAWFVFDFFAVLCLYELAELWFGGRGLVCTRQLSTTRLTAGQSLTVRLQVRRAAGWPLWWLRVAEDLPSAWQTLAKQQVLQPLWATHFALEYQLPGLSRGVYDLGDTRLVYGDLLGLVEHSLVQPGADTVWVFPQVVPVRGWAGYRPVQLGLREPTGRRSEESSNVIGVREYVPGDRLSRVHWPASARTGLLQAKEFELHVASELSFVADLSTDTFRAQSTDLFELEMIVTASLLKHAYDLHQSFALTLHGETLFQTPSGTHQALWMRSLEALALASPRGPISFAQSLARLVQGAPLGTTLAVISPQLDVQTAVAVEAARRRGPVEWFVPMVETQLTQSQRQALTLLETGHVNVHLIAHPSQLGNLQRGGASKSVRQTAD
ncbi:DUF58 domain-containing protein [Alicyclobacillaceae bacterium I2511]|nr:DUF58 domain-containing protein [Alicyclobacillaceae bacterium I2511]